MTVKPIIKNLDKNIPVDLGKRLAHIGENIIFVCPECGYEMKTLDDPADLEYGYYYGNSECWDCGVEFEDYSFKVEAFIKISIKR